jgi:hypothetical protein
VSVPKPEPSPTPAPAAERRSTPQPAPPRPASPSPPGRSTPAQGATAKAAPAPSIDFTALENRLRSTGAIGVFTKLTLKNQIDDLFQQFKSFHQGRGPALNTLRERYDLLVMKILSLLQDDDAALAKDVSASREAIWDVLVDPEKFAKLA